jgi:hypothetical protein
MKTLLVSLTSASFVFLSTSSQATLILYEPFDYPAGTQLGGAGTSPLGYIAPNGQRWITRSPASGGTYDPAKDIVITNGSLSYPGLPPSIGNSVRFGSATGTNVLYTDAIALPTVITEGSVYWSAIVHFHSAIPASGGLRTSYAALSAETADPATDAGFGAATASGTGGIPLPASAWIRYSGTTQYHLGSGKQNSDGIGTSAGAASWQAAAATPNQQGNIAGTGQDWATIDSNPNQPYFIVMKYTYDPASPGNTDKVSMWVNPAPSTLGYDDGEASAGVAGGSYYSATNAYTTANIDTPQIQSFMLIAVAQSSSRLDKTLDVSLDELRIGTTWADVTPLAPPQIISIAGAGTTSVTVTWTNVQIGTNYVLQYSTNLATTNWSDLAPVTASDTTASQTDNPPSGAAVRFYRVLKP